ncbi:UNVERIFIED_CONTAM: hypothetical protein H355_007186, partial [Colinus virginianus]
WESLGWSPGWAGSCCPLSPAVAVDFGSGAGERKWGSRQGYEDPHWQYPAATYGDNHTYQSHQWQPMAWQGDRDMTQVKPHSKSTAYRDQHYYRGYHPNLTANHPGRDSSHAYDAHRESSRHSWAGLSNLGEASGQPQEVNTETSRDEGKAWGSHRDFESPAGRG